MAEKRRGRKRKEEFGDGEEKVDKAPSKEEYSVAKWIRNNVPHKRTKFIGHNVQYFTGTKAVDALMESEWSRSEKEGVEPLFPTRAHCIDFLDMMLRHKLFHRAKKRAQDKLMEAEVKKKKTGAKDKDKDKEKKKDKRSSDTERKEANDQDGNSSHQDPPDGEEKKGKKKKVRLEMHLEQVFVDNLDAYVWIYEPTPVYYPVIGTLVVLAAIVICLFPLWPSSVRSVVYYLSVLAACFLVLIITLALVRFVLFSVIWLLTAGNHHLWILPNLTEDVGFFASFWPLYHYEYKGSDGKRKSSKAKKSKKGKYKDSDDEEAVADNDSGRQEEEEESREQEPVQPEDKTSDAPEDVDEGPGGGEESGSDGSSSGQTAKDFEILDKEELQL